MRIRTVSLKSLKPSPYNPRVALKPGDPMFERLRQSVETFGIVEPIVWNKRSGQVVGGHQRLAVLAALGHREAEVVVVNLLPEREKALNIALNKIQGEWDEPKLAALLDELGRIPDFDLSITGFETDEIGELLARVAGIHGPAGDDADFDVDSALDTRHPAVTKPGELIVLGQHRLLCGDSTKPEDVRRVMDGKRAILFATDPPYCVGYDGTNHPSSKAKLRIDTAASGRAASSGGGRTGATNSRPGRHKATWDSAEASPELYDGFISVAITEALRPNAAWYCWHASRRQAMVEAAWVKHGAFVHCQIIWAKNRPVLTRTWYGWQHEPCFMGWIQGKKPPRVDRSVPSTLWPIDIIPNGPERPDHPTPKPLEVFEIPMKQHMKAGDICYEPFGGSGTQIIAAERLGGRRCFTIELSPHYCDVIVRRWIHLVGELKAPRALVKRYRQSQRKAVPA